MQGTVKIVNVNANANAILSAAGRISTTKGTADEIYEKSCGNADETNIRLIEKVLASGHLSVLEHVYFNLSFDNVSVAVEQFMIEFRLASFTVKSRRYVDFTDMGYYVPDFGNNAALKEAYHTHMRYLFDTYAYFLEKGVPKEDARFILPYAFCSNFYCSMNARELVHVLREMVAGRGTTQPEIYALGTMLLKACKEMFPYFPVEVGQLQENTVFSQEKQVPEAELVSILSGTENPELILKEAYKLQNGAESGMPDMKMLLGRARMRELEQLHYTISFNKISLASLTHLARHRMQSLLVPDFRRVCDFSAFVVPKSIIKAGEEARYREVFQKSKAAAKALLALGLSDCDRMYLFLSGLTIRVMTTMNAHELFIFFRLRTCNRAQWEIKNCADALLGLLRAKYPDVFCAMGPSCYAQGKCPEGKMSCKEMQKMCEIYGKQ